MVEGYRSKLRELQKSIQEKKESPEAKKTVDAQKSSLPLKGGRASIVLSPEQQKAAQYAPGTQATVATAGSGKTTTMSWKIASLMDDYGIADHQILATTFTKAGANDLKARIDKMVGRKTSIQTGTIHSFCVSLLMEHFPLIGLPQPPTILDESQRGMLLDQITLQVTGLASKKDITTFSMDDVERWLYQMDVEEFSKDPADQDPWLKGKKIVGAVGEICRRYRQRCQEFSYVDFDSILTQALRILRTRNDSLKNYLPRHVFIDEAQDLSAIQWFIIEELAAVATSLDVIGDDDQSIYAWRLAMPRKFREFVEKADRKYFLSSNRRCAKDIVSLASQVIATIPPERRIEKDLSAVRNEMGHLRFTVVPTLNSMLKVAEKIKIEVEQKGKKYSDYAFIARNTTHVFPAVEGALKRCNIPYKILGGKSAFSKTESRLLRSLGNIVAHQQGQEPFAHWTSLLIDVGVSAAASDNILKDAQRSGGSLESMNWAIKTSKVSPSNKESLESICATVDRLRGRSGLLLRDLFEDSGVSKTIKDTVEKKVWADIEAQRKEKGGLSEHDAQRLRQSQVESRLDMLSMSLQGYMNEPLGFALMSLDVNREEPDDNTEMVTLSTAHSSKGLEWEDVFVLECNRDSWPSGQAGKGMKNPTPEMWQDVMDEERRLLYVAITRAKNNLYLMSGAYHPLKKDEHFPSDFLPHWLKRDSLEIFKEVRKSGKSTGKTFVVPKNNEESRFSVAPEEPEVE